MLNGQNIEDETRTLELCKHREAKAFCIRPEKHLVTVRIHDRRLNKSFRQKNDRKVRRKSYARRSRRDLTKWQCWILRLFVFFTGSVFYGKKDIRWCASRSQFLEFHRRRTRGLVTGSMNRSVWLQLQFKSSERESPCLAATNWSREAVGFVTRGEFLFAA